MIYSLFIIPLIFSILLFLFGKKEKLGYALLILCAVTHLALSCKICLFDKNPACDIITTFSVLITSIMFVAVAVQSIIWIPTARVLEAPTDGHHSCMSNNIFLGCMTAFLGTMSLVLIADNFGLLWVAIEATTLVSAPLICYHRNAKSLEAMWKYLLICSVGIAIALFGTMLLAHSIQVANGESVGLSFSTVMNAEKSPLWFKAAFILILAGYGTKMGLAPFHTWLPDAHSEAPAIVSALLSGSLLNCSFIAILRFYTIAPKELYTFCNNTMIGLGLLSLFIAAIFILKQSDYKRMLAYSSVEHMGIILILTTLISKNENFIYIVFVHMILHSLIKTGLFLSAGNILLSYGTRSIKLIKGMFSQKATLAWIWFIGILLITGTPPSYIFGTEFIAANNISLSSAIIFLFLLFVVFSGMIKITTDMTMGKHDDNLYIKPVSIPKSLLVMPSFLFCLAIILSIKLFIAGVNL